MKTQILTPLITRWKGEKRILFAPFEVFIEKLDRVTTVPEGFEYDGESVPRFFPELYALFANRCEEGAAFHDFGYSEHSTMTRAEADAGYLELMALTVTPGSPLTNGYRFASRWLKWAGVRTFGSLFYKGGPAFVDDQQPRGDVK